MLNALRFPIYWIRQRFSALSFAILLSSALSLAQTSLRPVQFSGPKAQFTHGWQLQSACATPDTGETISAPGYRASGWLAADVPSTVLAAQVEDGLFRDPFFGKNLLSIPGTDYPVGKIYGYLPMTAGSPYRCSWWYRTEFSVTSLPSGRNVWLHFNGINYRADIWVNGTRIADSTRVAGAFRSYEFEISNLLRQSGENAIAIEVFAQAQNDLGIDFLDWNPAPADKNMGLWREAYLTSSGVATVRNAQVISHFKDESLSQVHLTIVLDVANHSNQAIRANVRANLGRLALEQQVELAALEQRIVRFTPEQFPQLQIKNPKMWWPYQYGDPHLEQLTITCVVDRAESDSETIRFGIREVQASLNKKGFLEFQINHRRLLIRGAGWVPDMFYREPRSRLQQELAYVKDMHLNALRLEGKLGSEDLFDLADEMGILIMAGWQCCDFWQQWDKWTSEDYQIASASLYSQISRLRSHPSILAWLNGSDEPPIPPVEKNFLDILEERDWPDPVVNSAADRKSVISGASGVKMSGPYDYVPPEYWYLDKNRVGGAFGFNTETSPGVAIPLLSSLRRTLPQDSLWPIDGQWRFHAGLGKFAQFDLFNDAMKATYGPPTDLADYDRKAQLMAYDGERAMFEAYGANKYTSTGVIQWTLNNAWPSFIWHLYDYYLVPGGGYFGTRKANEPLHIQFRYDDQEVVVVNSTLYAYDDLQATLRWWDLSGKVLLSSSVSHLTSAADSVSAPFATARETNSKITFHARPPTMSTCFLKLELRDQKGRILSNNFYWVAKDLAELDWKKSTYYYTPAKSYADMKDLERLPPAVLKASAFWIDRGKKLEVKLQNVGNNVAFFVHLRAITQHGDKDIVPVTWSDNYVSLMPRESIQVTARASDSSLNEARIHVYGWNVAPKILQVENNGRKRNWLRGKSRLGTSQNYLAGKTPGRDRSGSAGCNGAALN